MDFLDRMQDAANRGQKMVEGLLLYSRVTTQGQPFVKTDLNQTLRDVISNLEVQIEEQDGTVDVEDLPIIEGDPTQMQQLFQNLINNALKFHHPERPPVVQVVSSQPSPEMVQISVSDQGIGFDPTQKERIFQPFQRLHGRSEFEGSGIGLSICKKIVERHDGEINVESLPDKGTTFTITLPVNNSPG
jgi:signal transduction histidine kinase